MKPLANRKKLLMLNRLWFCAHRCCSALANTLFEGVYLAVCKQATAESEPVSERALSSASDLQGEGTHGG